MGHNTGMFPPRVCPSRKPLVGLERHSGHSCSALLHSVVGLTMMCSPGALLGLSTAPAALCLAPHSLPARWWPRLESSKDSSHMWYPDWCGQSAQGWSGRSPHNLPMWPAGHTEWRRGGEGLPRCSWLPPSRSTEKPCGKLQVSSAPSLGNCTASVLFYLSGLSQIRPGPRGWPSTSQWRNDPLTTAALSGFREK